MRLGLFEAGKPSSRLLSGKYDVLGSPEHRAIARQAVRESLVLLKNNGGVLPLNPGANILVAGDGADDVARQSGGWTLSRSEEHTSELQSLMRISYAVFCLKKKQKNRAQQRTTKNILALL